MRIQEWCRVNRRGIDKEVARLHLPGRGCECRCFLWWTGRYSGRCYSIPEVEVVVSSRRWRALSSNEEELRIEEMIWIECSPTTIIYWSASGMSIGLKTMIQEHLQNMPCQFIFRALLSVLVNDGIWGEALSNCIYQTFQCLLHHFSFYKAIY